MAIAGIWTPNKYTGETARLFRHAFTQADKVNLLYRGLVILFLFII